MGRLRRPRTATAGLVLAMAVSANACSRDPKDAYCDEVRDNQEELSEIIGEGGPTALLEALAPFRALQAEAPADVSDEWAEVVNRIEALDTALSDAGVDPATYGEDDLAAGLAEDDRERIEAAGEAFLEPAMEAALTGLQQHARDVCRTQLWYSSGTRLPPAEGSD